MSSKDDGGPAFPPNAGWKNNDPDGRGMSLRDYFAAAALNGMLVNHYRTGEPFNAPADFAQDAYEIADAMLEGRKR